MNIWQKAVLKRTLARGEKGVDGLGRINDKEVLARIAAESESEALACAAAAKVNTQSLLCEIVRDARTNAARLDAAVRIRNAWDLISCLQRSSSAAQGGFDQGFWDELVARLPHENLLDVLSMSNCVPDLLSAGMSLLKERGLVFKTAMEYDERRNVDFVNALVFALSEGEDIATVAASATSALVRRLAIRRIGDAQLLKDLFAQETNADALLSIAEQLKEEQYFVQTIYRANDSRNVQLQCAEHVTGNEGAIVHIVRTHPTWDVFSRLVDKIHSVPTLVELWKSVDAHVSPRILFDRDCSRDIDIVLDAFSENDRALPALWEACSDTGRPSDSWLRSRILRLLENNRDALDALLQKTPDDDPFKMKIVCARDGHDWEVFEQDECRAVFPEGIDPCTENMCFLEYEMYTTLRKRCRRCGEING